MPNLIKIFAKKKPKTYTFSARFRFRLVTRTGHRFAAIEFLGGKPPRGKMRHRTSNTKDQRHLAGLVSATRAGKKEEHPRLGWMVKVRKFRPVGAYQTSTNLKSATNYVERWELGELATASGGL